MVSATIGGLAGNGTVIITSGAALKIGANNIPYTLFSGRITGGASTSIEKIGTGVLSLQSSSSSPSSYTGLTTITGGALVVSGGYAIPGGVSIGPGAALQLMADEQITTLNGTGEVNLTSGNLSLASGVFSGFIQGGGRLLKRHRGRWFCRARTLFLEVSLSLLARLRRLISRHLGLAWLRSMGVSFRSMVGRFRRVAPRC